MFLITDISCNVPIKDFTGLCVKSNGHVTGGMYNSYKQLGGKYYVDNFTIKVLDTDDNVEESHSLRTFLNLMKSLVRNKDELTISQFQGVCLNKRGYAYEKDRLESVNIRVTSLKDLHTLSRLKLSGVGISSESTKRVALSVISSSLIRGTTLVVPDGIESFESGYVMNVEQGVKFDSIYLPDSFKPSYLDIAFFIENFNVNKIICKNLSALGSSRLYNSYVDGKVITIECREDCSLALKELLPYTYKGRKDWIDDVKFNVIVITPSKRVFLNTETKNIRREKLC